MHISLGIPILLVFLTLGMHISLGIPILLPEMHISLGIPILLVFWGLAPGMHISLGISILLPGMHISLGIPILLVFWGIFQFIRDPYTPSVLETPGMHISLGIPILLVFWGLRGCIFHWGSHYSYSALGLWGCIIQLESYNNSCSQIFIVISEFCPFCTLRNLPCTHFNLQVISHLDWPQEFELLNHIDHPVAIILSALEFHMT